MKDNSRKIAYNIIYDVIYNKAYSNIALNKALKGTMIDDREKGFITELVYGTLSKSIYLEYKIKYYLNKKINNLSKQSKIILQMGFYQIEFMDSVSDFAAVDESVKLIKRFDNRNTGFVNAVLRKRVNENITLNLEEEKNIVKKISVKYSISEYIAGRFLRMYKETFALELLESLNEKPNLYIRLNYLKCNEDKLIRNLESQGIEYKQDEQIPQAFMIKGMKNIATNKLFIEGGFVVQDLSSMYAVLALEPNEGDYVLDICSAPGGKSFFIADLMNNKGRIDSMDISEFKLKLLKDKANNLGIKIIETSIIDASVFNADMILKYDKIIVDAPCSGFGIIRRKPEIRFKVYEDVKELPLIQSKILENASKYLKNKGTLIYSTCTLEKKENNEIIDNFLMKNPDFYVDKIYKEFYPNVDKTDGFFIAKLKKK